MTSRAVVDLPQPDSPTMPSTSPLSTEKLTSSTARTTPALPMKPPRTGKCLLIARTSSSGCCGPPTSSAGASTSGPDIHRAPHSVAQEGEADRHDEDHRTGQGCDPRIDVDRGAQRVEHQAPFGLGRLGAEAEEGQSRGEDHAHADQAGRIDEDRTEHVAEHVHAHDRERSRAGGARRIDEIETAHAGGD